MDFAQDQIDREYLLEISGGDAEFERDLIATFIEAAPALLESYASAVSQGDSVTARHAAHTLKGSSRSIGATIFAKVCEEAERAARTEDIETCRTLQPQIEESFAMLKAYRDEVLENVA
jgi:HPt (histidine-containing phosphotransfer) domain-containing protein